MEWRVYILRLDNKKYYIGSTKNITRRLKEHTCNKVLSTKNRQPIVIVEKRYEEYSQARKIELHLKKQKTIKSIIQFIDECSAT